MVVTLGLCINIFGLHNTIKRLLDCFVPLLHVNKLYRFVGYWSLNKGSRWPECKEMDFLQLEINLYLKGITSFITLIGFYLRSKSCLDNSRHSLSHSWHWESEISAPGEATGISNCCRYIKFCTICARWSLKSYLKVTYIVSKFIIGIAHQTLTLIFGVFEV